MAKLILFKIIEFFGYRLTRKYKEYEYSRMSIYRSKKIDRIIDIGANSGQFSLLMRDLGYCGRIQSFEPMKNEYDMLVKKSSSDSKWEVFNFGIGESSGNAKINISQNSYSSSFLDLTEIQLKGDASSEAVDSEIVSIIDFKSHFGNDNFDDNVALKLDVQGYEFIILKSIEDIIDSFVLIQLEVSFKVLYKGESLYYTIDEFLRNNNFELVSVEPGFYNSSTGEMLQADFIYARTN